MTTKYFAYYITNNKPVLMLDFRKSIKRTYGHAIGNQIANQIEANLLTNDWENLVGDNINTYLNNLVLVKITDVNNSFADAPVSGNLFYSNHQTNNNDSCDDNDNANDFATFGHPHA